MFTGIVESVGEIVSVEERETTRRFLVGAPGIVGELSDGDSVAVDGACLTVVGLEGDAFAVDVIGTTLDRTIAGGYHAGSRVNLERAAKLGTRLDGHIVQGHVDGVGTMVDKASRGEFWLMDFRIPDEILGLTIEHGSITLNGVSLTVSELPGPGLVRIGIIPYTHQHTNLGLLEEGTPVNVEGDMIGKYVERILSTRGG